MLKLTTTSLPDDPSQILKVLVMEKVPIKQWLSLALLYHKIGKVDTFQQIIKEALKDQDKFIDGSNDHMFDDKKARFDTMNSLASFKF